MHRLKSSRSLDETMSVTSVTAGTGGVTVTGSVTQPVINIPQVGAVASVTSGANIEVTGTTTDRVVGLQSPLVLTQPLTLANILPTNPGQLGYTFNVPLASGFITLTSGTPLILGSTTVGPGIYFVTCNATITIASSTVVNSIQLYHSATPNASVPDLYSAMPFQPTAFATSRECRMVLSGAIIVSGGSSTFSLQVLADFSSGTCTSSTTRVMTVSRIA